MPASQMILPHSGDEHMPWLDHPWNLSTRTSVHGYAVWDGIRTKSTGCRATADQVRTVCPVMRTGLPFSSAWLTPRQPDHNSLMKDLTTVYLYIYAQTPRRTVWNKQTQYIYAQLRFSFLVRSLFSTSRSWGEDILRCQGHAPLPQKLFVVLLTTCANSSVNET